MMLEVHDIHAAYGNVRVLFGLSLTVKPGEIHCLLGRNGAGKTTAIKSVMGLIPLQSGRVELDGENLSALSPHEIPGRGCGPDPPGPAPVFGTDRRGEPGDRPSGSRHRKTERRRRFSDMFSAAEGAARSACGHALWAVSSRCWRWRAPYASGGRRPCSLMSPPRDFSPR